MLIKTPKINFGAYTVFAQIDAKHINKFRLISLVDAADIHVSTK